ncbi:Amino-acid acetyltransferase, mitochondrial [Microbotryomycetes sp. JL201]|nr:Amino-acid acetyltransferase, mitochondrial [Microbotryomycetes sp. JL201]
MATLQPVVMDASDPPSARAAVAVTRAHGSTSGAPSRSASLVVSSRLRQQVAAAPRGPLKFAVLPPRANGPNDALVTPTSRATGASLLKRLSRTGTQLVRRVSGSKPKAHAITRSTSPSQQRLAVPDVVLEPACDQIHPSLANDENGSGAPLRRGLRALGRSRSEAHRRNGVRIAKEEEKMDELVMRTELSIRGEDTSEARSGMGSYFWSDSLGLCWDGREQVHPDLLAGQQTYSSDANFVPQSSRVVYASTLSTFPPRPPLRRLSSANAPAPPAPKLSEAQAIAAAYRDANKLLPLSAQIESPCKPGPMTPPTSSTEIRTFARSVASSASSCSPSDLNMPSNLNGPDSLDSSTSVESMREASPTGHRKNAALLPSPLGTAQVVQRYQLVDDGPVVRPDILAAMPRRATFETPKPAAAKRALQTRRKYSIAEHKQAEKDSQRDFILSVLESQPSARDSRFYLRNFDPARATKKPSNPDAAPSRPQQAGTGTERAVAQSSEDNQPAFPVSDDALPTTAFNKTISTSVSKQRALQEEPAVGRTELANVLLAPENRHTALVKIQGPFSDRQLESIAEGMVYLKKLGLVSIIVLDNENWMKQLEQDLDGISLEDKRRRVVRMRDEMKRETLRLTRMLELKGGAARPLLEGVLCVSGAEFADTFAPIASTSATPYENAATSDLFVDSLSGIRDAIRRGEIPVIPPIALDASCFSLCVSANDAVKAISSGLVDHARKAGLRYEADQYLDNDVDLTPVRIMIINREGGIPSPARGGDPHLSINLSSEFDYINQTFIWKESHPTSLANLDLVNSCLSELPRTASAVIVSHRSPRSLIGNLITNKPAHSPSLHQSLLPQQNMTHQPTIVRRGLPIRVFRSMSDIDKDALTALLEESFGKSLDAGPFYERLERDLDFCIIAGDYEGVAIVTNELPDPLSRHFVEQQRQTKDRAIAYLDKFAVLPSLQGDGTVDFLWGALRDESFGLGLLDALNPNVGGKQGLGQGRDLVWRSRSNNPVNKWYFERSNGFIKIPPPKGSSVGFSLFWCEAEDKTGLFRRNEDDGKAVSEKLEVWADVIGAIPSCWKA